MDRSFYYINIRNSFDIVDNSLQMHLISDPYRHIDRRHLIMVDPAIDRIELFCRIVDRL